MKVQKEMTTMRAFQEKLLITKPSELRRTFQKVIGNTQALQGIQFPKSNGASHSTMPLGNQTCRHLKSREPSITNRRIFLSIAERELNERPINNRHLVASERRQHRALPSLCHLKTTHRRCRTTIDDRLKGPAEKCPHEHELVTG